MLGLASCDDKSDLGIQQRNEQENVLSLGGITVNPQAPFTGTSIELESLKGRTLDVLTYNSAYALPAGAYMEFKMELASTAAFDDAQSINLNRGASPADAYTVGADELSAAINAIYGRQPVARDLQMRIAAYMVNGTELLRIRENEAGAWFMGKAISMTPIDPQLDIESEYFLVNSLTGMSLTQAIPMVHGSRHQYDDPNFSVVIDVTIDDLPNADSKVEWKVAPASAVANDDSSNLFGAGEGTSGEAMEGKLARGGAALWFTKPAKYQIRINMETLTFEIGFANDQLYLWTPQTNFRPQYQMGLHTSDYVHYDGLICTDTTGKWKLTGETNMRSLQIGMGAAAGQMAFGKTTTPFDTPADAIGKLVRIQANLQEMTYTQIVAQTIGVVGGNNDWGGKDDQGNPMPDAPLTVVGAPAANGNCIWEGDVTFSDPAKLEFKIRANNAWNSDETPSFDLGGDNGVTTAKEGTPLAFGGSNLTVPETGTYHVTLNLSIGKTIGSPEPYTLTIVKK